MSSVFFPVHVVVPLRRLLNVISTLSISKQYLLLKQANVEVDAAKPEVEVPKFQCTGTRLKTQISPWRTFEALGAMKWSWWTYWDGWDWPQFTILDNVMNRVKMTQQNLDNATVKRTSLPFVIVSTLTYSQFPDIVNRYPSLL